MSSAQLRYPRSAMSKSSIHPWSRSWLVPALALVVLAASCKKSPPARRDAAIRDQPDAAGAIDAAPAPADAAPDAMTGRPSQGPLPVLPALVLPDDPKRREKIVLGHALFFDKRLSVDGSLACYSCHQNEDGNGGHDPTAIGPRNRPLPRHSPVIWNVAYFVNSLYWDGRSPNLEHQAKAAWSGGNMGIGADYLEAKATEILAIPGYKRLFRVAFPGQDPGAERLVAAIAEYERTLICSDTAYDKYAAGDRTALTEPQQLGLDVFLGKGQCGVCHAPPHFSSAMGVDGGVYFNVGIGTLGKTDTEVDAGRMVVTKNAADWAAFKPPSLRNVSKSAPYFHDGSVATFEAAVRLMVKGGIPNKNLSPLMKDRGLDETEILNLISFLRALDCPKAIKPPTIRP